MFFFPFGFEWREREKEGKKGSKPAARRACVFRNQRKCYSRASDNLELRQAGNNARRRNKTTEKKPHPIYVIQSRVLPPPIFLFPSLIYSFGISNRGCRAGWRKTIGERKKTLLIFPWYFSTDGTWEPKLPDGRDSLYIPLSRTIGDAFDLPLNVFLFFFLHRKEWARKKELLRARRKREREKERNV